ncbi:hypothetical protein HanPSC8_Chr17g0763971 [Helianthus annuus]|nr:hypothetical protein HanPSC8_Chr17g0763971 [Helianthus annuus]
MRSIRKSTECRIFPFFSHILYQVRPISTFQRVKESARSTETYTQPYPHSIPESKRENHIGK